MNGFNPTIRSAPLLLMLALVGCNDSLLRNPLSSLHESFEGQFIDQRVKPKTWIAPAQRDWTGLGLKSEGQRYPLPSGQVLVATQFQGPIEQPQLERYLQGILDRLAIHAPITDAHYEAVIIGDGGYGNAQAMPDGVLAVPLGFLANVESEDEIAWLLGHELAHVLLEHHDVEWIRDFQSGLAGTARNALHATQIAAQGLEQVSMVKARMPTKRMEKLYSTTKILFDVSTGGALPAWQRSQEDEADLLATDLIVRAGYTPDAGLNVVRKIGLWAGEEVRREEQRLAAQAAAQEEMNELMKSFSFAGVFELFENAIEREARRLRSRVRQVHRDAEPRQRNLEAYIESRYPDLDRDINLTSWRKAEKGSGSSHLISAYERVWNAQLHLYQGEHNLAEREIRSGIGSGLGDHTLPRLIFARLRIQQGELGKAEQNLQIALRNKKTSLDSYREYVDLLLAGNRLAPANNSLERAWREFDGPVEIYPQRIRLAVLRKDKPLVITLLNECRVKAYELSNDCESASEPDVSN
ncbi:MAG: M48 family metalloprotease [Chromatiaceae bacterium]|nr:M48 family metalloprotease [Gammaproteobacteria bacterium]MCB1873493.1 M48 family metalloprotease [Gammaproteobacteria bacterium]MCP5445762.1 M48 family metalloprotease [Chromatiaceae bacterium]